ncbi:hypothetical protein ACHAXS_004450 [Conticribra weissflogii]
MTTDFPQKDREISNRSTMFTVAGDMDMNREQLKFSSKLQRFAVDIRNKEIQRWFNLNSLAFIAHHDDLLPYWSELASALQEYQSRGRHLSHEFDAFQICDIQLSSNLLDMLSPSLKSRRCNHLWLENNELGKMGSDFLVEVLEENPNLSYLSFVNNPIGNDFDSQTVFSKMSAHQSLRHINLMGSLRNVSPDIYKSIICGNEKLNSIDLRQNAIDDSGSATLAQALRGNVTLKSLDLRSNNISCIGRKKLMKCIFNTESLNEVSDSNHSCDIVLGNDSELTMPRINKVANKNVKKMKLFTLLCSPVDKCANVWRLNSVPEELVPNVLEFLQHYPTKGCWKLMTELMHLEAGLISTQETNLRKLGMRPIIGGRLEVLCESEEDKKCSQAKALNVLFDVFRTWALPNVVTRFSCVDVLRP